MRWIRLQRASILTWLGLALVLSLSSGCQDVDWNWDTWWLKQPQRTARPIRPSRIAGTPRETPTESPPKTIPPAEPDRAAPVAEAAPPPTRQPGEAPLVPVEHRAKATASPPIESSEPPDRPFYNLYLVRAGQASQPGRDDRPIELNQAPVRGCARLLEILYVPQFSAGSDAESYLIFEDRRSFEAAQRAVVDLDVPAWDVSASAVGGPKTFAAGVGLYYAVQAGGVMIDRATVSACERHLSDVVYSATAPASLRWAAGVLAGRLVAEYVYDYPAARVFFAQAARSARSGSLEYLTTQWWRADTYMQEGQRDEARRAYEALLKESGDWRDTRIVQRSRSLCAELGKR